MPEKKCPKCRIWNSENAIICDCGYNFVTNKYEFRVPKKEIDFGILSSIIALVSLILLIIIVIMIINNQQATRYIPNHIEEQMQHAIEPLIILLLFVPLLNIFGMLAGGLFRKEKKKQKSININIIILFLSIIILLFEIF